MTSSGAGVGAEKFWKPCSGAEAGAIKIYPVPPALIWLVVTGGSLTRRPKKSLRCLLVEVYTLTNQWVLKPKT